MSEYVAITDIHLTSSSRVRTGDVVDDVVQKLKFVRDYCNQNDATLLMMGDIFDKATIPDFVKSKVIPIFLSFKHKPISISGNHDELYSNIEYKYKTSYEVLSTAGCYTDLDNTFIDKGDCVISNVTPVKNFGKPQIVLFHGFLNQDDGKNTFRFTDLNGVTDVTTVLLGHDHVEYEDLKYTQDIKIIRPGSFLRGIRNDANCRKPKLVHLKVKDGRILTKKVEIECRDWEEIFKTKEIKTTKAQQKASYENIINSIRNSQKSDLSFEQALNQVADPVVVNYALQVLEEVNLENNFKKV